MSDIGKSLRDLTPQQRALLELRMKQKRGSSKRTVILPRAAGSEAPLSFAQQRLWFLEQLEPAQAAYNTPGAYRLEGPLDVTSLRLALDEIVRRHETLRSRCPDEEGNPRLAVDPPRPVPLDFVDLTELAEAVGREQGALIARAEARRPFRLDAGPLLRVTLVRLAADEHVLLVTLHHIVSDAWSLGIFLRELTALYTAFGGGVPSPLSPLPVQYGDFALWQREWLSGDVLARQLSYWRMQLEGAPSLELLTDRPRSTQGEYRSGRESFRLGRELSFALHDLARREDATVFMVLLGAFQALLHRYTGQRDIVVGSVVANRRRSELEGLIGFFANTLVMRTNLDGDPSFRELLRRVRTVALEAYDHQDVPLEKLVEELAPERSATDNPLFQVVFAFQNVPRPGGASGALSIRPIESRDARTRFDLTFELMEGSEGVVGAMTYRRDLFRPERIAAMARHFEALLRAAAADPDRTLSALPMIADSERLELLAEGNETHAPYPQSVVHRCFEAAARAHPNTVALLAEETRWSYAELDRRANRLAHHLHALGVGFETRVGVCLERSPELVTALLAVLKTGGAYVPLDPSYPEERLRFMLDDAGVSVVVTQAGIESVFGRSTLPTVRLDADRAAVARRSERPLEVESHPDALAYIMYTSGSTGTPKGVEVRHRSVVRLVTNVDYVALGPGKTLLQLAPVSFDASTFEIWGALLTGARLALYPGSVPTSEDLARALARYEVTTLWLTTSLFNAVVDDEPEVLKGVRQLLVGGEALSAPHIARAAGKLPDTELINGYGPTEGTTFTCCYRIPPKPAASAASIPIGHPIANTCAYLLDASMEPVPRGVAGELWIGGDGLARGYRGDPGRTAERFLPDPFSSVAGARLYRTGDRARRRPDGSIDFLGRWDQQVKLSGFRIELGEIEAVLREHADVASAAVLVSERNPSTRRLVAFVVPRAADLPLEEVRVALTRRLPDYMVPSEIVSVASLPLTPNGKLDKEALLGALPDPDRGIEDVPPRGPIEEALASIWQDVLGCARVGARDHFFRRGGQSLAAARMVARMRKVFDIDLPLRAVFEAPVLAELSERVVAARREGRRDALPSIVPAPPGTRAPLSFSQQRLWLLDRLGLGGAAYNVSGAVRLRGPLDREALIQSVLAIVRRHESLRTTIEVEGASSETYARVHPAESFSLRLVELDASGDDSSSRERLERFLAEEAGRPIDLTAGPLFRCHLVKLASEDHVLAWTMHHIICDGWSIGVFFRDLRRLYRPASKERGSLTPLEVQYGDYARWQQRALASESHAGQLEFWRERLSGAPAPVELPLDRRRAEGLPTQGGRIARELPRELAEALRKLSGETGATFFVTLFAGFQALVHRLTGAEDIVVGTPVANRTRAELENLIGFFVNTLAVRIAVDHRVSFRELVERVRAAVLASFDHAEVPFEKLVAELKPERKVGENPFFQSVFALQSAASSELSFEGLEGLEVTSVPFELTTLRFDVEFHVFERPSGLLTVVSFNAELYEPRTVERWLDHFEALLRRGVEEPDRPVGELRLSSDTERATVERWNATGRDYPSESTLTRLFEEVVARRGDATAIELGDVTLSYGELNRRANQLAHHLRTLGVGPESRVGLEANHTVETLVAILGILKAGGAYVPIDASYPAERIALMLADASVTVLVASERLASQCPRGVTLVDPVSARAVIDRARQENPVALTSPQALAYVMYTSGSTGTPKGVAVPHLAVVRLLFGVDYVSLGPDARILQLAPISFDASTFEIWGALLHGGVVVLHPERVPTAAGLRETLSSARVSTLWLTASLFNTLVDEDPSLFATVQELLVGGEALSLPHIRTTQRHCPRTQLVNGYGPTEGTTFTCCYRIPPTLDERTVSVSIGTPIANTHVRVLGPSFEPVPVGMRGDLFIGGDGLARGYLDRPELTAERFVPDPLSRTPGARLYRTGDVVRYLSDGRLAFIGRSDDQLKLRGFRVEPGEVATLLSSHPAVREAAVVIGLDTRGDKALFAYFSAKPGASVDDKELAAHLSRRLPDHMVPAHLVRLDRLPLTENGKLDRRALPVPSALAVKAGSSFEPPEPPSGELEERIAALWCEVLQVDTVGVRDNFFEIGGHSLLLVKLQSRLQQELGERAPSAVDLFRFPTVRGLARHLGPNARGPAAPSSLPRAPSTEPVAIIGLAGRFPGAENLDLFWERIRSGQESVTFFTEEELLSEGLDPVECRHPQYIKARGIVENADLFDSAFFGYTPREAEILDPQHRIFLETAWEALERAGYGVEGERGRVGLFAGATTNAYAARILANPEAARSVGHYAAFLSTDKDFLSTRVSYKLNLTGPSVTVQTACSTSLVALHMACQSLRAGECDVALAGGVSLGVPRKRGYQYAEGGIVSRDGHCRPFDAAASGTVPGEGAGVVVLKRLSESLKSGDSVKAIVLGSAVNNDGSDKVGYTAPSVGGQVAVVSEALRQAGVASSSVSYVETHGTGTSLGDPIEVAALKEVFGGTSRTRCGLGSLKSNLGHLDAAAGVASLIKTALALEQEELPPSLHFETANPELGLENSPFEVIGELRAWPRQPGAPRRAGVSSFGIGGTNAHVILEEAPKRETSSPSRRHQLVPLSARTETALAAVRRSLAVHLGDHPEESFADVCFTLSSGRTRFEHRAFAVCESSPEAVRVLQAETGLDTAHELEMDRGVAFVFPGQGTQYVGMGRQLYEAEPVFRDVLDEGFAILRDELDRDLREVLYPAAGGEPGASALLAETELTQPTLFLVQYAAAELLRSWGLRVEALLGHSIGEYVAACVSGVFDFETGLRIAALRGRLMQSAPRGAMTSVALAEREVAGRMGAGLSIAAVNGAELTVVSGGTKRVTRFEQNLAREEIPFRRLQTSHAFHSDLMEPVLTDFEKALRRLISRSPFRAPSIPFVSNVTGTWVRSDEATDPSYWVRHLRAPVRFADGARTLLDGSNRAVVELGGGRALPGELRRKATLSVPALAGSADGSDGATLARSLGRLWLSGVVIDWEGYYRRERRHRIPLPTYPFERKRHWVDVDVQVHAPGASRPLRRSDVAEWLYAPVWRSTSPLDAVSGVGVSSPRWLVFEDTRGLATPVVRRLERQGASVTRVRAAGRFRRLEEDLFELRPDVASDYDRLLAELEASSWRASAIIHFWSLDGDASSAGERFEATTRLGFASLARLTQSVTRQGLADAVSLTAVTANLYDVTGSETLQPEAAPVASLLKVLPQEHHGFRTRHIDLDLGLVEDDGLDPTVRDVLECEATSLAAEPVVALRGRKRFVPEHERVIATSDRPTHFRTGGVYWITGGLGRLGVSLAEHLARSYQARLVLLGRSVPPRDRWRGIIDSDEASDLGRRLARIVALEEEGAEILAVSADVADVDRLGDVLAETDARFGALHGVIHAAGITSGPSFRAIDRLTEEDWESFFTAKAKGLFALDEVLRERELDFVFLMSSIATVLGGLGFSAYAAANAFMDHWAATRSRSAETVWTSVAWDGIRFDDESERAGPSQHLGAELGRTVRELAMTPNEGIAVFDLLSRLGPLPNIVVSTVDLPARVTQWAEQHKLAEAAEEASSSAPPHLHPRHERPALRNRFTPPCTETERSIVAIWERILGIQGIGIHDDFFELGGHSLSALQIVSHVSERFAVEIPMHRLFERPTAAAVAGFVESIGSASQAADARAETGADSASASTSTSASGPEALETLLDSVESMSEGEARELLHARRLESEHDE